MSVTADEARWCKYTPKIVASANFQVVTMLLRLSSAKRGATQIYINNKLIEMSRSNMTVPNPLPVFVMI